MRDPADSRTIPLPLGLLTALERQVHDQLCTALSHLGVARVTARNYCGEPFASALVDATKAVEVALSTLHCTAGPNDAARRAQLLAAFSLSLEEASRGTVA